ncbi:MAG: alanine racemase, partial [Planctomycetes bacterium]|nr:alanine racemase [Planctomycetota bacterium]
AALRDAGLRAPVLVMGVAPDDEIDPALECGLTLTVVDAETAAAVERRAAARSRRAAVHLKIDTGMNRLGVRAEEAAATAAAIAGMAHLDLEGAYTHFACADCDDPSASARQLARLKAALGAMREAGVRPPLVHAANSSALVAMPESHFGMVRTGLALYGVPPCKAAETVGLRPALSVRTRVAQIKRAAAGEGVSYGHRWRAARDSVLGVLPIGYADGYPRALGAGGQARAGGRLVPVAGTVCMDAVMVDLTDVPGAAAGLEVVLIEADNASPLGAAAVARLAGTIPYEIFTGLGRRLPRVYR